MYGFRAKYYIKKLLKSGTWICDFTDSAIFFNGEINQWAVTLSEKQRILFTFFADKINNTKSIEIALEKKDIDNSYIPITEIGHKFSESVSVTDAVSHCLDDFCKKLWLKLKKQADGLL